MKTIIALRGIYNLITHINAENRVKTRNDYLPRTSFPDLYRLKLLYVKKLNAMSEIISESERRCHVRYDS